MPRNSHFKPGREPLAHSTSLQLDDGITGPIQILNPTHAQFRHVSTQQAGSDISFRWNSRNNRKGRHALRVRSVPNQAPAQTPPSSASPRVILRNIGRMFTKYPVYDVSWVVAYLFTWGSIVWVFNAFFAWLPSERPSSEFTNEILYGGGITAFIGATIFEVGSIFLMLEAVNANRAGCFGWAVEQLFEDQHHPTSNSDPEKASLLRVQPALNRCVHHHPNRKNLVGKSANIEEKGSEISAHGDGRSWAWWPSWADLRSHYLHELGFLASFVQLLAASIFWIAGLTALPGINNKMSQGLLDGIYWTPQVVGGTGFIISGFLFMLETQKRWYKPALHVLGWHIGFWNLIGGLGFTLCPAFGYDTHSWAQYQAGLSTFWASWAFLIGSVIQLYESLDKNPVKVKS